MANIDEKFVLMSAILMLFANKGITKCQKVAKYQQHLVVKNVIQLKCVSKQLQCIVRAKTRSRDIITLVTSVFARLT